MFGGEAGTRVRAHTLDRALDVREAFVALTRRVFLTALAAVGVTWSPVVAVARPKRRGVYSDTYSNTY